MWTLSRQYAQANRFKQYEKKHPDEFVSCFNNLDRLLTALNGGLVLRQCTFGFLGNEGMDVYRIGQSGVRSAHETRLYIYAEITGTEIHLLTIGDKRTQQSDINWCHSKAREIRGQEHESGQQ